MFLFFSNRMGCLTSIIVSVVGTLIVILVMKGCHAEASNVMHAQPSRLSPWSSSEESDGVVLRPDRKSRVNRVGFQVIGQSTPSANFYMGHPHFDVFPDARPFNL